MKKIQTKQVVKILTVNTNEKINTNGISSTPDLRVSEEMRNQPYEKLHSNQSENSEFPHATSCPSLIELGLEEGITVSLSKSEEFVEIKEQQHKLNENSNIEEGKVNKNIKIKPNNQISQINERENERDEQEIEAYKVFRYHSDFITKLKIFTTRNNLVCSISNDCLINIYHIDSQPELLCSQKAHSIGITDFDLSQDEEFMVTSSLDGAVKLWQIIITNEVPNLEIKLKSVCTFQVGNRINCVSFDPMNKNKYCAGDSKGKVHFFSGRAKLNTIIHHSANTLNTNNIIPSLFLPSGNPITAIAFSKNSKYLFVADSSGLLSAYQQDSQTSKITLVQRYHNQKAISSIVYSHINNTLLVSSCDNKVKLFSIPSLTLTKVFFHSQSTYRLRSSFSFDHKIAIACSEDCSIQFFDIETSRSLLRLKAHNAVVSCCDMNEEYLVSGSYVGDIAVWKNTKLTELQLVMSNLELSRNHTNNDEMVQYNIMEF